MQKNQLIYSNEDFLREKDETKIVKSKGLFFL